MAEPEVDPTLLMKLAQRPSTLKVSLQSTKERFSCKHYLKSFKYNPYLTRHMRINHKAEPEAEPKFIWRPKTESLVKLGYSIAHFWKSIDILENV